MNYTPNTKVSVGTVAGAIVTVIVAALGSYGVNVTAEVAGALVVLVGFGLAYVVPEKPETNGKSKLG